MITDKGILYIEPSAKVSAKPLVDELTRKMTAAFRFGKPAARFRGCHVCACGVWSGNCDFTLPNGEETNSLCIHYLAYHRADIPAFQLEKVRALDSGEAEPTVDELEEPE